MKRLLIAAALASLPSLAVADPTLSVDAWGMMMEKVVAARMCDFITFNQAIDAMTGAAQQNFGTTSLPPAYGAVDGPSSEAGVADAKLPGYCANFDPDLTHLIDEMAAYGATINVPQ
jgi:hypothetical protein